MASLAPPARRLNYSFVGGVGKAKSATFGMVINRPRRGPRVIRGGPEGIPRESEGGPRRSDEMNRCSFFKTAMPTSAVRCKTKTHSIFISNLYAKVLQINRRKGTPLCWHGLGIKWDHLDGD